MSLLQSLFGIGGPKVDLAQKIKEGATIIDVRTPEEFKSGHVKGSINIPLDKVQNQCGKLDNTKAVITCCRSGARSGMAADVLKSIGFDCYNGGPWNSVRALKGCSLPCVGGIGRAGCALAWPWRSSGRDGRGMTPWPS